MREAWEGMTSEHYFKLEAVATMTTWVFFTHQYVTIVETFDKDLLVSFLPYVLISQDKSLWIKIVLCFFLQGKSLKMKNTYFKTGTPLTFICSKSRIETVKNGIRYVQGKQ